MQVLARSFVLVLAVVGSAPALGQRFAAAKPSPDQERAVPVDYPGLFLGFPKPRGPLVVARETDAGSPPTLLDLLEQYERVTGQAFAMDLETVRSLERRVLDLPDGLTWSAPSRRPFSPPGRRRASPRDSTCSCSS